MRIYNILNTQECPLHTSHSTMTEKTQRAVLFDIGTVTL